MAYTVQTRIDDVICDSVFKGAGASIFPRDS